MGFAFMLFYSYKNVLLLYFGVITPLQNILTKTVVLKAQKF